MNHIKKQQERVNDLLQLIKENPDLEIVPMVDYEICASDDHSYWMGSWGTAKVDEYLMGNERIYFRSDDEDMLVDDIWDNIEKYPNISREDAEKIVAGYNWVKCICVRIELP